MIGAFKKSVGLPRALDSQIDAFRVSWAIGGRPLRRTGTTENKRLARCAPPIRRESRSVPLSPCC